VLPGWESRSTLCTEAASNCAPVFRVLGEADIERLFQAALSVLERTGVEVRNARARDLLAQAGVRLDERRARIPSALVREALSAAPAGFTLWGRYGLRPIRVELGQVHFGPGPTCTYIVDPETGERRPVRRGDVGQAARLCDGLDQIGYVMGLGLLGDVTPDLAPVYEFAEMIANTEKPILAWSFGPAELADIHAIAQAVAGGAEALRLRPSFALFATSIAPLVHANADLADVFYAVEHGVPVVYQGCGSPGLSAPITGAGTLVVYLAQMLSGLTMIQLARPGAPVCLAGVPEPMDLRTCRPAYGAPETSLYSAAMVDLARFIGLPYMGTAGASEAKTLDLQAAVESTVQVLLSGLSGATLVHDLGFLDCADIGSPEMLVLLDEMIGMCRRVMRGIDVRDETMLLDEIDRVGPGGQFIAEEETARRCRQEIWRPTLADRDPWVLWQAAGAPSMRDNVRARMAHILATHHPTPLAPDVEAAIAEVLRAAEARHAGSVDGL
jgi:trimethylamine---corrinoid protein Co-methyltransferase